MSPDQTPPTTAAAPDEPLYAELREQASRVRAATGRRQVALFASAGEIARLDTDALAAEGITLVLLAPDPPPQTGVPSEAPRARAKAAPRAKPDRA